MNTLSHVSAFNTWAIRIFQVKKNFCKTFLEIVSESLKLTNVSEDYITSWKDENITDFEGLSRHITKMCTGKRILLMIDEVDKVRNNRVFLDFLSVLREKYLNTQEELDETFQSVILAGVYDIKNIKLNMINKGLHELNSQEDERCNSPWNIATDFEVTMSFSSEEIATMLNKYEQDHKTGMSIIEIAEEIYVYTSGYPVLVSTICKTIAEKSKDWTASGVVDAVKQLIESRTSLLKSLSQNLEANELIYKLMYDVLILGLRRSFVLTNPTIDLAHGYGFIRNSNGRVQVSNKVFERVMTDYFISKDEDRFEVVSTAGLFAEVTKGNQLNMQLCLERF